MIEDKSRNTNRSSSPLLWQARKEKPDVLPGSEKLERGEVRVILGGVGPDIGKGRYEDLGELGLLRGKGMRG